MWEPLFSEVADSHAPMKFKRACERYQKSLDNPRIDADEI